MSAFSPPPTVSPSTEDSFSYVLPLVLRGQWDWALFFSPPRGAFVIAPSIEQKLQSMPFNSSYRSRHLFQSFLNTPASFHSWNLRWAELEEQIPVAFRAFHWHPVLRTKKMAFMALLSSTRFLWHPRGWCVTCLGRSGLISFQRASGMR